MNFTTEAQVAVLDRFAPSDVDPYAEGWEAEEQGCDRCTNPYPPRTPEYHLWDRGFVARSKA